MTRAPANLMAVRKLLLDHLDDAPGSDDLEPGEVGIVGNVAHRGGYHCGSDRVLTNDYSVVESPRDRAGLTLDAAALDVGQFRVTTARGTFDLPHYSKWLVAQCAANTVDTRDIREVIYSPDGTTVKRWDRLGRRSTGDSSHRGHTHKSYFRDAIKAGRDQTAVVRRYLTEIGLIEGDDMSAKAEAQIAEMHELLTRWRAGMPTMKDGKTVISPVEWRIRDEQQFMPKVLAGLASLAGKDFTDEAQIVQGVLAGLTPEAIAAAIPPTVAKQVADELARRIAGTTPQS